jgi:DNA helicase-2/ATP-dependent DNA helicase PcrA
VPPTTAPETYLADLNEAQKRAVTTTEGPLLVIAGAGSGKTRVLTYRVAHLLKTQGVEPNEILAITFTNKAAAEMRTRIEAAVGPRARAIWILTFHAACGRILRREAERLGYRSNFTIYDSADQVRLVRSCLEELERDPKRFTPRGIHSQISNAKNQLISADEYASRVASFYDQTVADVYGMYQRRLFAQNAVDFDDLLMLTVEVLRRFPEARERWAKAFRYVMVDEYQDTNHAQYVLLQLLAGEHQNLMVVGDPDQCFIGGTLITMADGTERPVEQVVVGDEVLSCYGSGVFGPARVERTHRSTADELVEITTGSGRGIVSTVEHLHFVAPFEGAGLPRSARDRQLSLTDFPRDRELSVVLCGASREDESLHELVLSGIDARGREQAEALGLPVSSPADRPEWRLEQVGPDLGELFQDASLLRRTMHVTPRVTARLAPPESGIGDLVLGQAGAVQPGMALLTDDGELDTVVGVRLVTDEQKVYDLDIARTHNYIANGIVTHNSIYAFRGADIGNILSFERDFPGTQVIPLEQNYRSTNAILNAANAVIEHNRERKEKNLWSELGEGDPVRVLEVEDEHAEARFVAAEVAALLEYGLSLGEIAVVYRTNAQSRVLEDVLVRQGVAYQVIGGPRFYERAEIKDAIAYLQAIDNPYDAVSLTRIANRPRRGVGDTSLARLQALADGEGISLWEAVGRAEEAGLATASLKAVQAWRSLLQSLMAQAQELSIAGLLERVIERTGYPEHLLATLPKWEAEGKIENLEELVGVAREYEESTEEPSLSSFLQEISLYSDQDALRDGESSGQVTLMTLHNAKGLEYRAVFMLGVEEGIFPHSRSIEENDVEEERRLCYVGMTRAKERLTMLHAARRSLYGRSDANLPSRFLDELPAEGVERERLRPTSWSGYNVPAASRQVTPRAEMPSLSTGDAVRHNTLGAGIVTRIEPDGVVTVRFEDGSERRLMLEYAPLERIAG